MAAAPSKGGVAGTEDPEHPTALDRDQLNEIDASDRLLTQQDTNDSTAGAL